MTNKGKKKGILSPFSKNGSTIQCDVFIIQIYISNYLFYILIKKNTKYIYFLLN